MSGDTPNRIRQFVMARYPGAELRDDEDIFALGLANSLFAMELVMFIEQAFGLSIPNEELTLDNFRTVGSMSSLVGRLTSAPVRGMP
jgi:acyl carrier protein